MFELLTDLSALGTAALGRFVPEGTEPVVVFEPSARADVQCTAALGLAKAARRPPRELAEVLRLAVAGHPAVERSEVAGAGFVNLWLRDRWLADNAPGALRLRDVGGGRTVVLDFSSPNVAKPMHVGHVRSTILGEALKRVLRASGYTVVADNHLGDWGTQFGKLLVAYARFLDREAYAREPVQELLRIYVRYNEEEKAQREALGAHAADEDTPAAEAPELLQAARAALVKLQQGDPTSHALWQEFVRVSMVEFERSYARLGVSFDVVLGESAYNPLLAGTVERLLSAGIARHSDGAVVVTFDKATDGEALPPLLVRKADGGYLYGTSDIAAVFYRQERWDPERILYVTDERQQLHFKQFFAACRRLGARAALEHVWFGLLRLPEGTFSTRDGNVISLEKLLDEAERRALEVARGCNDALSEDELREVARVVGLGAVKYNDLSKDRQTLVTFTWDKALALTGNTAPYLQYAYARVRSMLRKAQAQGFEPGPVGALAPTERALVLALLRYPLAVEEVARTARPHVLCDMLYALATQFSTFYNELPVLKADAPVRASRLTLATLVADVLQRGLGLLGIEVLERM